MHGSRPSSPSRGHGGWRAAAELRGLCSQPRPRAQPSSLVFSACRPLPLHPHYASRDFLPAFLHGLALQVVYLFVDDERERDSELVHIPNVHDGPWPGLKLGIPSRGARRWQGPVSSPLCTVHPARCPQDMEPGTGPGAPALHADILTGGHPRSPV